MLCSVLCSPIGVFYGICSVLTTLQMLNLMDETSSFWLLFIFTRPLAEAIGDLISAPLSDTIGFPYSINTVPLNGTHDDTATIFRLLNETAVPSSAPSAQPTLHFVRGGGWGFGYRHTSAVLLGIMIIVVSRLAITRLDVSPLDSLVFDVFKLETSESENTELYLIDEGIAINGHVDN